PVRREGVDQARRGVDRPLDGARRREARVRRVAGERSGPRAAPVELQDASAADPRRPGGDRGEASAPRVGGRRAPRGAADRRPLRILQERGSGAVVTLSGRHYKTGEGISVSLKNGTIAAIKKGSGETFIGPGLVDLQINGFRGLDFNTLPVAEDLPGRVTRELWSEGVTSYYATVITNSTDAIEACVRAIARACELDADAAAGIAGIHLEGPFISGEDGPRGAHDKRFVCPPDWKKFDRWQRAAGGRIRLITLSPEYKQ